MLFEAEASDYRDVCAVIAMRHALVPAARYGAVWVHRLLLGAQWREAWPTPIDVPVVDLDAFDGGLTPDREGGGYETLNLHFKSVNGRKWVFRSMSGSRSSCRRLASISRHR